jgi:uncharacterized FlaG/YvyC family protein
MMLQSCFDYASTLEVKPMEVRSSLGGAFYPNLPQNVPLDPFASRAVSGVSNAAAFQEPSQPSEGDIHEMLERTIGLVSMFERNLKFEMIKDAGILQIQVIDSSDGTVVRKIPPDEIVKWVTYIKDKLIDNINVLA